MLLECRIQTQADMNAVAAKASVEPNIHSQNGPVNAALSDATEENRVRNARQSHVAHAAAPASKDNPSNAPRKVATPLPPLNLSQTGNRCPKKAETPATCAASLPKCNDAINTGARPLHESNISVAAAADLLPVLSTFVVPMFPDPVCLMSPSPRTLVITNPNAIDPTR